MSGNSTSADSPNTNILNNVNILIIEGGKDVTLFKKFLKTEDFNKYTLSVANTLKEGLNFLGKMEFDVILLDLILPNGNGIDVFNKFFKKSKKTPIVVTSIDENKNVAIEAMRLGAQDYLIKDTLTENSLRRALRYAIERKKLEIERDANFERLVLALQATTDGIWDWTSDNKCYYSPHWEEILGYEPGTIEGTLDAFYNLLHPDDVTKVKRDFDALITGDIESSELMYEFRMLCKDGTYKWIMTKGKVVERFTNGLPKRIIGTHTDINFRKLLESDLNRELEKHIDNLAKNNREFNENQNKKLDDVLSGFCEQHKEYGECQYK